MYPGELRLKLGRKVQPAAGQIDWYPDDIMWINSNTWELLMVELPRVIKGCPQAESTVGGFPFCDVTSPQANLFPLPIRSQTPICNKIHTNMYVNNSVFILYVFFAFRTFDYFIREQIDFRMGSADMRVSSIHKICTMTKSSVNYTRSLWTRAKT